MGPSSFCFVLLARDLPAFLMPTPTKAALEARIAELEEQLASLNSQQRDHLVQLIWLQRQPPLDPRDQGCTRDGVPYLRFAGQYAALDRQSGRRQFGAYKNFIAFGPLADKAHLIFSGACRLVAISAYERPQANDQGPRRSEWVLTAIRAITPASPGQAAAPAAAAEPSAPATAAPASASAERGAHPVAPLQPAF
jgi:hypothetical protein